MGLRSRFGKARADELKKLNTRSHSEMFAEMFGVEIAEPCFYGDATLEAGYDDWLSSWRPAVGISPYAGGRWPAKELQASELEALIGALLRPGSLLSRRGCVVLIGSGSDREKNLALAQAFSTRAFVWPTPMHWPPPSGVNIGISISW